jgi:hypothetical protein
MIARVFTSKTKYTPDDDLVFFEPPDLFAPEVDTVHVSCLFTWDKPKAERLAEEWAFRGYNVEIGGPAYDDPGGVFVPGMYVKKGYVQTSRGCPNKCSFCLVPSREGKLRELPICEGQWVMDNNLLACSDDHIDAVFTMLQGQSGIKFLGGLEAKRLKYWHIERLSMLRKKISMIYLAYDNPSERGPVGTALRKLHEAGFKQTQLYCFVLVGYKNDTQDAALERCEYIVTEGGIPFASYYRSATETQKQKPKEWSEMTRWWTYTPVIISRVKRLGLTHHKSFKRGMFTTKGE